MKDVALILLAGGTGTRFGHDVPKQFFSIKGKPIALYSLEIFLQCPEIFEIIIVADSCYHSLFKDYKVKFAKPGDRRQDSLKNGLQEVSSHIDWICIHDSARPIITPALISKLILEGKTHGAAALGIPARNTIKEVEETNLVIKTFKRETLWEIQTPQIAIKNALVQGLKKSQEKNIPVTDDVSLIELQNLPVKIVMGDVANIKITHQEDLPLVYHHLS